MRAGPVAVGERRDHEVALLDVPDVGADVLDDADELVPDRTRFEGGLAAVEPEVGAADAREHDADYGIGRLGDGGVGALGDRDGKGFVEGGCAHEFLKPAHRVRRSTMRYRRLGSSELEVSEISLGSWLTFAGGVGLDQTRACTDAAFDVGINFFDTANVYGRGAAESAWGDRLGAPARLVRAGDEGPWPDVRRSGRPWALGGADREADRRVARAAPDRLRRPLPGAPLRPGRRDRGDDRGAPAGG